MHDYKLIKLLRSLDKEVFRRLGKFLNSPFYNYSSSPILLYESLKRYYPDFNSPKLTQEFIWNKVYPNEKFLDTKFWQLTSKLTRLVERFLITIELEKHPQQEQQLLIQALASRNKNLLKKEMEVLEKNLNNKDVDFSTYVREKFLYQLSISNYHALFDISEAIQHEEEFLVSLEMFYLTQKLKTAITLKGVEKHRNLSYSFHFIDEIISLIESDDFIDYPQLRVLSSIFKLGNNLNPELYYKVKNDFFKEMESFNHDDKKFIFHQLFNYTISQINNGEKEFKRENFELYQESLKQNLIVENGKISYRVFTNIISQGASLKEFEWTEEFMKETEEYLPESSKEDALTMSQGLLSFFKNDFSKTIDLLINYQFDQSLERLRGKGILLRCYFELFLEDKSYYGLFNSYLKSYEKYLRRDEMESENRVVLYLNFTKSINKFAKLINENKFTPTNKNKLINDLEKIKMILKPWLIDKINSIKKRRF